MKTKFIGVLKQVSILLATMVICFMFGLAFIFGVASVMSYGASSMRCAEEGWRLERAGMLFFHDEILCREIIGEEIKIRYIPIRDKDRQE